MKTVRCIGFMSSLQWIWPTSIYMKLWRRSSEFSTLWSRKIWRAMIVLPMAFWRWLWSAVVPFARRAPVLPIPLTMTLRNGLSCWWIRLIPWASLIGSRLILTFRSRRFLLWARWTTIALSRWFWPTSAEFWKCWLPRMRFTHHELFIFLRKWIRVDFLRWWMKVVFITSRRSCLWIIFWSLFHGLTGTKLN